MKAILKVLLASLFVLCILTTPFNALPVTAKFEVRNSNLIDSCDEIADSPNTHEMMENAYPYRIFEDKILGVREFDTSRQDAIGLEVCKKRHDNFLECSVLIGTFKVAKVEFAGSEWDIVICNNTANLNLYGEPTVPYKKMLIPIGDAEIVNIAIYENLAGEVSEAKVLPGLMPLPVGLNSLNWSDPYSYLEKNFYADPLIYFSDREFPSEFIQQEVVSFKGSRFLALTVFPFKFYPKDSIVRVFDTRVSIEFTKPVSMITQLQTSSIFDENSGYVIIAPSEFSGAVESFSQWKEQLGFSVQITRLEQIYSQFSGRDNVEKVRNFISESYSANGTEYYLLIGDCDVCPVREVWDPVNAGMGCDNGTEPSDLYYECLDGDWDANGNSIFGEPDDDVDLFPEVKVGRIPVNTTEDVERVLAMIRKIEENPEPGEWIKNFLLIAPWAFTPGDSAAALEEEIYKKFLADSFFNPIRLYDVDGSLSPLAVSSAMNQGVGLVDFFDHGRYDMWVEALTTGDVLNLNNGNRSFLAFAMACETAAFDYQEYTTIGEAFFRNQNGGAIGYIGATRIAWAGYDCFDGLHHRFWNYFLKSATEHYEANPKQALQDALIEMASTYDVGERTLETIYQAIYFGDPALNLYWKHNVTTTVTPNLETSKNGVVNGTCSMLHSDTPIAGEYRVVVSDPIGAVIAEKTGNLGSQGNYTVSFTTTSIPGNYTIETILTDPFNYTHVSTFTVGALNVTMKLNSDPIYGVPIQVSGEVLDEGNPVAGGVANISIVNKGVIINSTTVPINGSGQYQTEINLTTFGVQALHVWVSNATKHGGTFVTFKVKRGDILVIADDCGALSLIYPGGWYDFNRGSSTSYYSFYHALIDEYNVSVYRLLYDPIPSLAFLQQYSAVIVTCGDHYGYCLTNPFRDLTQVLIQYHNSEGDLIFEGGDVAYSLTNWDYTEFMESVLHASFIEDLTNMGLFLNNTFDPITQGLPSQIPLSNGLGSPSVDLVLPTNGSEMVSGYVDYLGGSITAFSGGSGLGSVVYFSFSVDGIDNMEQRNLLIENSVEYLLYPTLSVKLSDYALLVNTNETISIQVKDSDTKQPVKNATVAANGCEVSVQNETDSNGECSLFIAPTSAGIINVTAEKTGYLNFTAQIIVYSKPKLTARITPDALRKKTQTASIRVTDFYEYTDVDSVNVTLHGCGVSETGYTNSTGTIEFTITPTSYGYIQLNASKYGYENYTDLVDVYINAVILDSFGTDYPMYSCWDDLNSVWQEYGIIPIEVDIESLNKYGITYQDLVESEADVLIIPCSASTGREYTDDEILAIRRYTLEGHGLIATAGTLYEYTPNNNKLTSLFGMREDLNYAITFIANSNLNILEPEHPLFTNIPSPYPVAVGMTVCPSDYSWDQDDLLGGTYIAMSDANEGAIIVYNGAVFVCHWVGYMSNNFDFQLMYNSIVWSKYEVPEHDLKASLDAPSYLEPNQTGSITARVDNMGLNNESDITLMFLVNDTIIHSEVISDLTTGYSYEISYPWTPTAEATYNITVYMPPLLGEENILNNQATKFVEVRYPLIHPLEGQWANYNTTFYDENGTIVGTGKIDVTYDHYVAPYLIYVTVEIEAIYGVGPIKIKIEQSYWMIVNIFDRMVEEGYGTGMGFSYWIETNIKLGSEVNIAYYTATVVDDEVIRINTHPIDCWVLVPEWVSENNITSDSCYDKMSGLLIRIESERVSYPLFQINPAVTITVLNETNIPIGYEHELEVSLETPESFLLDESALINATIYNFGLVEETDVDFEILLNGSIVCSGTIPELGNSSSTTISYLWTPIKKGIYNITAYVHPAPGENLITNNADSKTVEIAGDETPPIVSITSPQDGAIITSTNVTVEWIGFDNETGINYYLVYLDGNLLANTTENSYNLTALTEGFPPHTLVLVAYDNAGNLARAQVCFTVDATAPNIEIVFPKDGYIGKETNLTIVWMGSEAETRIAYYLVFLNNTQVLNTTSSSHELTGLAQGNHGIKIEAYDLAGNTDNDEIIITLDTTAPTASVNAPANGSYLKDTVIINITGYDVNLDKMELYISGELEQTWNTSGTKIYNWDTTTYPDDFYNIRLVVYDKAGSITAAEVSVIIDNKLPIADIRNPAEGDYLKDVCDVTAYGSEDDENFDRMQLYILGELVQTWNTSGLQTYSWNTSTCVDGLCSIKLIVYDKTGSVNFASINVIVDNAAPAIVLISPENDAIVSGNMPVDFYILDSNLLNVTYAINEGDPVDITHETSFIVDTTKLDDGANEINMTATDKSGNSVSKMLNIFVDNTKPSVTVTNPTEGTTLTGTITIEFTASDEHLTEVLLYIDAAAFNVTGLYSYEWNTTEVGDGTHVIRFVAYDKAGNMGETSSLSVKTVNVQKGNEENYSAGRDFGLVIGVISGLAIGLIIGFAVMLASRKKSEPSET
jgi:hypothetical protein